MTTQFVIVPKLRCLTCPGTPFIIPDENQAPEDAGLDHLIVHKDDEGGGHELSARYVIAEIEVEEMAAREDDAPLE